MADKDGKIRLRLAEDIINDQVGGAGWTYLDIALQVDKYSPKTVLVKTRKCDQKGKIVLEPKARQKTSNYLVPKDPSAEDLLDKVSVQAYPKKASWKQTYSYGRSVSGNVSIKAVEAVGFSAEGSKTTKRYVETTCTDLEHRSVDIEDLRNALCALSAQTSAEGMRDETSFLVVTDVLVGKDVSIVKMIDKQKDIEAGVKGNRGGAAVREASSLQHEARHDTEDIVLAIKLARVHYDKDGAIKRDSVVLGGSYEGNYTLGYGNDDRKQHYAVKIMAKPLGVNESRFKIRVNLLGLQNSAKIEASHDICETGLHQTRKSHPTGSKLLPLKGILVSVSYKSKNFVQRLMRRKKESDVIMSKVLVTDLEEDKTYICPCHHETSLLDHIDTYNYRWFDCKEWREAFDGQEVPVTIDGNPCNVHEDDPIVRVFGDRPFSDFCEICWSDDGKTYSDPICIDAKNVPTFKEHNIQANAHIKLLMRPRRSSPFYRIRGGGEADELELEFEACQVTLRVMENERIYTLLKKVMSLWVVFQGDQAVDRASYLSLLMGRDAAQGGPNKLVIKMPDVQPDDDATGLAIQVTVPAGRLKITDCFGQNVSNLMDMLSRVYARMNVVHDGKVITDLTQTYRQLGIQASAHVQLQSWDPENPPVVPTFEEIRHVEKMMDVLIQELQWVEFDMDEYDETPTAERDWEAVRDILWRYLEVTNWVRNGPDILYQDRADRLTHRKQNIMGDPDIPPGALAMLIRAVGEDTVAGEVLQTILEAALEQQGGVLPGPTVAETVVQTIP